MLVEVAAHQLLFERVAVEERFPYLHFLRDAGRQRFGDCVRRPGLQPVPDGAELPLVQRRQPVRHSPQRIVALVRVVFLEARARLRPVEGEIEWLREHRVAGQRMRRA